MIRAKGQILALFCLTCLAYSVSLCQTFSPHKAFGRYQQFVWQEQHGLPQNTVQAITRTRDGYLWLGTLAGAARFDGARFTVFDNGNTPEIKSSYITALLEDRQGNLWLGSDGGGLARLRDGRFTLYTTRDGLASNYVRTLFEDRAGNLWIGTEDGGMSGSPGGWRSRDGRLWFPSTRGVVVIDPKRLNTQAPLVAIERVTLDRETLPAGQTGAACNQLDAFINQVNSFVYAGALTQAQGQALITAANSIKGNIGR